MTAVHDHRFHSCEKQTNHQVKQCSAAAAWLHNNAVTMTSQKQLTNTAH